MSGRMLLLQEWYYQLTLIMSSSGLNVPALEDLCTLLKYFVPVTQLSEKNTL